MRIHNQRLRLVRLVLLWMSIGLLLWAEGAFAEQIKECPITLVAENEIEEPAKASDAMDDALPKEGLNEEGEQKPMSTPSPPPIPTEKQTPAPQSTPTAPPDTDPEEQQEETNDIMEMPSDTEPREPSATALPSSDEPPQEPIWEDPLEFEHPPEELLDDVREPPPDLPAEGEGDDAAGGDDINDEIDARDDPVPKRSDILLIEPTDRYVLKEDDMVLDFRHPTITAVKDEDVYTVHGPVEVSVTIYNNAPCTVLVVCQPAPLPQTKAKYESINFEPSWNAQTLTIEPGGRATATFGLLSASSVTVPESVIRSLRSDATLLHFPIEITYTAVWPVMRTEQPLEEPEDEQAIDMKCVPETSIQEFDMAGNQLPADDHDADLDTLSETKERGRNDDQNHTDAEADADAP